MDVTDLALRREYEFPFNRSFLTDVARPRYRLLRFPVVLCEDVPAAGANTTLIAFGDFKQGLSDPP